ncbi:MAG: hypothetical protein ACP5E2_15555 [Terracidiphilus sp.]
MLFSCLIESKKSLPVALLMLSVGLFSPSCGAAWQHTLGPILHFSPDRSDFFHGFCIGLGLALEIAALVLLVGIIAIRSKSSPTAS